MRRLPLIACALLLAPAPAALAEARFRPGPDGEVAADLELDLAQQPRFSWAMDPFLKVPGLGSVPDISAEQYKLEAVTIKGENPVAVVNGQVVRVGDRIAGRLVMRIEKDYVLLGAGGSIVEASLYDESLAPPAGQGQPQPPSDDGSVSIEEVRR